MAIAVEMSRSRVRSVAIRRSAWTAGFGRPRRSPRISAVSSRSSLVRASPQSEAGPDPVGVTGPTNSMMVVPAQRKTCCVGGSDPGTSRVRLGSNPAETRADVVRCRSGVNITTWSTWLTRFGCCCRAGVVCGRGCLQCGDAVDVAREVWPIESPTHDAPPVVRADQLDVDIADPCSGPPVALDDLETGGRPRSRPVADDQ